HTRFSRDWSSDVCSSDLLIRIPMGVDDSGGMRYTTPLRWFYTDVCAHVPGPPEVGSFCYALAFLAVCWAICYVLDRKKIYVKVRSEERRVGKGCGSRWAQ